MWKERELSYVPDESFPVWPLLAWLAGLTVHTAGSGCFALSWTLAPFASLAPLKQDCWWEPPSIKILGGIRGFICTLLNKEQLIIVVLIRVLKSSRAFSELKNVSLTQILIWPLLFVMMLGLQSDLSISCSSCLEETLRGVSSLCRALYCPSRSHPEGLGFHSSESTYLDVLLGKSTSLLKNISSIFPRRLTQALGRFKWNSFYSSFMIITATTIHRDIKYSSHIELFQCIVKFDCCMYFTLYIFWVI